MEQKLARWNEYKRNYCHNKVGPIITIGNVEKTIKNAQNKKATEPDKIPSEMLKIFGKGAIKTLFKLFNFIYDKVIIPQSNESCIKNISDNKTYKILP